MWICFNDSFLSIVQPPELDGTLLVRARRKGDIERVFPGASVERTPGRDYLFRARIARKRVAAVVSQHVDGIDYGNFKNSVPDDKLHNAYSSFWGIMSRLQPIPPYQLSARKNQGVLL